MLFFFILIMVCCVYSLESPQCGDSRPGHILSFLLPLIQEGAVVSYWQNMCTVHEVLVNRLGGLSLPRKSVVRLSDRPDMTLDV